MMGSGDAPPGDGRTFAGRYALLDKLGSGGFGTVWRAHDNQLRIDVALKITNESASDPASVQRFEREARVIARLNHENIVKIYDFGVAAGSPFYTMEFVAGDTLQKLIDVNRFLPLRVAARIARDVALALHHAHIHGIVHRDVKPQNVLVQPRDTGPATDRKASVQSTRGVLSEYRVVLTDFGLAKDRAAHTRVSVTGEVMGTPHYMAPEQATGDSSVVGPATDVYALGVTLYHLLSGRLPFAGTTMVEILANVVTGEPVPLRKVAPHLPVELDTIVAKAMQKDPAQRYPSALAFAQDCENFLKGDPIAARPPSLAVRVRRFARRNRVAVASTLSALLVAAGLLGWFGVARPALDRRARERESRARVEAAAARRAELQDDARRRLDALRVRLTNGDREATRDAEALVAHAAANGLPIVDACMLAARAHERAGATAAAMKFYLKAYHAGPDHPLALYELAHHFLRSRQWKQAIHFFRKIAARSGDPAARLMLAYALAGSGDFAAAARAFADARPPDSLPSHAELYGGEPMVPMHEAPATPESLREARELCAMFAGATTLDDVRWGTPVAFADLDADGRCEILVTRTNALDVYVADGPRLRKSRTIGAEGISGAAAPYDLDRDGRPELAFCMEEGFGIFRIADDRLHLLHRGRARGLRPGALVLGDVDGCGTPEVFIAHNPYQVHAFRHDRGDWVYAGGQVFTSSDIGPMEIRDLDGDGRPELLMVAGRFGWTHGYRAWAFTIDGGRLTALDDGPLGQVSGQLVAVPGRAGRAELLFTTHVDGSHARTLDNLFERIPLKKHLGLCRVSYAGGKFGEPEVLLGRTVERMPHYASTCHPLSQRGRSYAIVDLPTDGERRLLALDARPFRYVPIDASVALPAWPTTVDLDGDGDHEVVGWTNDRLVVSGLSLPPPGDAAGAAAAPPLSPRAAEYQEALLALAAWRGPEDALRALSEDLVPRFPEYEKDLLARVADVQQRMRRWADARDTLRRLATTFPTVGAEGAALEDRIAWLQSMIDMRERMGVDFGTATLLTNAPLRYKLDRARGVLRAASNSRSASFLAVPVRTAETSQRLEARVRVPRLEYLNVFSIGLADAPPGNGSWSRTAGFFTSGTIGRPGTTSFFASTSCVNVPIMPGDAELALTLDYVRELDVLTGTFRRGDDVLASGEAPVASRNPPQGAFLVVGAGWWQHAGDEWWGELEIGRIGVSATGDVSARAWVPRTADDWFLRAGGRYVAGDRAGAAEDYARVRRMLDAGIELTADVYDAAELDARTLVDFFAAFAERSDAGIDALMTSDKVFVILFRHWRLMDADERAFFRGAYRRAAAREGVEPVLQRLQKQIRSVHGLAQVPLAEWLHFEAGPDVDVARALLESMRKNGLSETWSHRLEARLLKAEGRDADALAALDRAVGALARFEYDPAYYAPPLKAELEALRREWSK
jgi:tRNA A-37 threonylcarbamoyl transferase component Bud32/tetratricopeptide (TPR) repeat protein